MTKILNPQYITSTDAKKLLKFFDDQAKLGIHVWQKGQIYTFRDSTTFQFTQDVVQRKRKEGKIGFRYEFISDKKLGKGNFGTVFEIAGTLALEPHKIHYKQAGYHDKTRVVKIQTHDPYQFPVEKAITEYELTKKATHLAVKEPTIQDIRSYSVMKKIKGRELFDVITDDLDGTHPLTIQQRIDLTQALVNALKKQVTDKGIIHRDLKGENIFVDFTDPIAATIFDFGLSVVADQPDGRSPGSPPYAAPEIWEQRKQTVKMDVFSMARIIALLWHVDTASYTYSTFREFALNATHVDLSTLFIGLPELNKANQDIIRDTLKQMVLNDTHSRFSVDQAIAGFAKLTPQKTYLDYEQNRASLAAAFDLTSPSRVALLNEIVPESKKRIAHILQQIEILKGKVDNLNSRQEKDVARTLANLAAELERKMRDLQYKSTQEYGNDVLTIIHECQELIRDNKDAFAVHRDDKYLWANVALGIAGLGLIYLAAIMVHKKMTGNYLFFNQTKTASMVEAVEKSMSLLENDGIKLTT